MTALVLAEGIDRTAALQKAQRFMPGKQFVAGKTPKAARAKAPRQNDAFYIFNAKDNGGFVVVSGDDRTTEILGYGEQGNLDVEAMPENMKWWLEGYARQIEALDASAVPAIVSLSNASAIAPLITAQWNQSSPYYYMCPDGNYVDYYEEGYDAENRCITGCVATALAQVMYYWKWPDSSPAIDSYTHLAKIDGRERNVTLKALPATTFKWDLMKDSYAWDETGPSADAVAELMRYCGQILRMDYSPSASAASLSPRLTEIANLFQYTPYSLYLRRLGYSNSQWESLVYKELSEQRPVLYDGDSQSGGHEFIIDGYDGDGLFHINWGWGGHYDSFFALSITDDPSAYMDYQYSQGAVIGFKPADAEEAVQPFMGSYITPVITIPQMYNRTSSSSDFKYVTLKGSVVVKCGQSSAFNAEIGWGLYQDGTFLQMLSSKMVAIQGSKELSFAITTEVSFGAGLADGKYQIYPTYRFEGETAWKRCDYYNGSYSMPAIIQDNILTLSPPRASFVVNHLTTSDEPEVDNDLKFFANITNTGDTYQLNVNLWVQKQGASYWDKKESISAYLDPGESGDIAFSFVPDEAGIYNFKITGDTNENLKTITVAVAGHEKIVLDGLTYFCTPDYQRAKVVYNVDADTKLTEVTIHSSVTVNGIDCKVTSIGDRALYNWLKLTSIIIPEGVESIGNYAFAFTWHLTKLELPSSVKEMGEGLLLGDDELTTVVSHITDPFAVSDQTFASRTWNDDTQQYDYFPSPATLYVPLGTKAKYEALSGWNWFAKIEEGEPMEVMVDGLKYLYATGGTTATVIRDDSYKEFSEVTIPSTVTINGKTYRVTAISNKAFYNCYNIRTLVIPEGVESIGSNAFAYMSRLTKLELPSSLKEIGEGLLLGNDELTTVVSHITDPFAVSDPTFANRIWNNDTQRYDYIPSSAALYVPLGTSSKYEALSGWTQFAKIEEGEPMESIVKGVKYLYATGGTTATVIKDDSYYELTNVTIPSTVTLNGKKYRVTAISNKAFYNCYTIKTLVISEGVESIGSYAFAYMYRLTKLELPSTVKEIGVYVIEDNQRLTSVVSRITEPFAVRDNIFANQEWNSDTQQYDYFSIQATLYVPLGTKAKYEALSGWTWFAGIEEFEEKEDGITTIEHQPMTQGTWYNLQGVKIEHPQKGVYIRNGRKVVVK